MAEYGYFLSCEEHGPAALIGQARMAEQAGFTSLWVSDHYHPWCEVQGESPFVWSVIGALAQATSLPVETAVTCPTMRIHPAIIAQAAATSSVMLGGRFRLGVGSGEALNEHVLGGRYPQTAVRLEMLEEAIAVLRQLFTGKEVSHHGKHYTVENARLYTLPEEPVPIDISGLGPIATELAGRVGDGYITTSPDAGAVARFRKSGGGGKPVRGGTKVCFGPDREEARRTVHRLWGPARLPGELPQVLPSPRHFEQAFELVTVDDATRGVVCGDNAGEHVRAITAYVDAGFDTVFVNQMGPTQPGFFDFYRTEVLPHLPTTEAH